MCSARCVRISDGEQLKHSCYEDCMTNLGLFLDADVNSLNYYKILTMLIVAAIVRTMGVVAAIVQTTIS